MVKQPYENKVVGGSIFADPVAQPELIILYLFFLHHVVQTIFFIVNVSYNIIAPSFIVKKIQRKNGQFFDRLLELDHIC